MNDFPSRETVEHLRMQYPKGTRVALVRMRDPYSRLQPGDQGSVSFIDDICSIFVSWDSGSSLGIVFDEDKVRKI